MRIIVITKRRLHKKTCLVIELLDKKAIIRVKELVNDWKFSRAILSILKKGKFIRELTSKEIAHTPSDLVLTDTNVYWNLL